MGLDEAAGSERLHGLDDFEVGHVEVVMLGCVEVFLGDEDTLCGRC